MSDQINYLYILFARSGKFAPSAIDNSAATIVNAYRSKYGDDVQYLGC